MMLKGNLSTRFTRRDFLVTTIGGIVGGAGLYLWPKFARRRWTRWYEKTFIARVPTYQGDIPGAILAGMKELGILREEIQGKRILLKPNLVESNPGSTHVNTHPAVVSGAAEAFLKMGAAQVVVAEGPGHCQDTLHVLEESGLGQVLWENRTVFVDLNYSDCFTLPNSGRNSSLSTLTFPEILRQVDWIVSLAKLKTHHWAGVTLSMKNLFGVMPGIYYGWPKNVLHWAGIHETILDITATLRPHFAIVDGIVGMEGDGPIMGAPKHAGVLVMGRNLPAVDATCARVMGINPHRVVYLDKAEQILGPVDEASIIQVGESIATVRCNFKLSENIPAQQALK